MAVDDLPFSSNPSVNLRRIPADDDRSSIRAFCIADQIVGQHRYVTAALDLWADHLIAVDLDLARDGNQEFFHRSKPIDAPLLCRVKVCNVAGVRIEATLRIPAKSGRSSSSRP